jgi:hypothetical protein
MLLKVSARGTWYVLLHVPKECRFGHRHSLQKTTLTTTFCYKIFIEYRQYIFL